jgi:hypothetical protein
MMGCNAENREDLIWTKSSSEDLKKQEDFP